MSITTNVADSGNAVTLSIDGSFNAQIHREFRKAYTEVVEQHPNASYTVDLSNTEYMDSSALGMLLLLRESVGGDNATVYIKGANANIKDILEIAKFNELFEIS